MESISKMDKNQSLIEIKGDKQYIVHKRTPRLVFDNNYSSFIINSSGICPYKFTDRNSGMLEDKNYISIDQQWMNSSLIGKRRHRSVGHNQYVKFLPNTERNKDFVNFKPLSFGDDIRHVSSAQKDYSNPSFEYKAHSVLNKENSNNSRNFYNIYEGDCIFEEDIHELIREIDSAERHELIGSNMKDKNRSKSLSRKEFSPFFLNNINHYPLRSLNFSTYRSPNESPKRSKKVHSNLSLYSTPERSSTLIQGSYADVSPNISINVSTNRSSNVSPKRSANLSPNRSSTFSPNRSTNLSPKSSSNVSPKRSSNVSPTRSTNVSPNRSTNVSPNRSANLSPNRSSNVSPKRSSNVSPNRSTNVSPNRSANLSPTRSSNVSPNRSTNVSPNRSTNVSPNRSPKRSSNVSPNRSSNVSPNSSKSASPNVSPDQSMDTFHRRSMKTSNDLMPDNQIGFSSDHGSLSIIDSEFTNKLAKTLNFESTSSESLGDNQICLVMSDCSSAHFPEKLDSLSISKTIENQVHLRTHAENQSQSSMFIHRPYEYSCQSLNLQIPQKKPLPLSLSVSNEQNIQTLLTDDVIKPVHVETAQSESESDYEYSDIESLSKKIPIKKRKLIKISQTPGLPQFSESKKEKLFKKVLQKQSQIIQTPHKKSEKVLQKSQTIMGQSKWLIRKQQLIRFDTFFSNPK